jgi:hypothetical protein
MILSASQLLGRRIQRRTARHYIGRLFATAVSMMLGLAIYDTQCGAKLFRVSSSLYGLFDKPFLSRWIFVVDIIARLIQARRGKQLPQPEQVIYEFPLIEWRDVRGSKLGYADFVELCGIGKHLRGICESVMNSGVGSHISIFTWRSR